MSASAAPKPNKPPVIDISLSDSDDNEFFTAPRYIRPAVKRAPPPRSPSPVFYDEDDDDGDESQKKRKRVLPKKKPSKAPELPEWTRRISEEKAKAKAERERERQRRKGSRARSSASVGASGSANDAILILSSDDDRSSPKIDRKGKGKAKAPDSPTKRRRARPSSPELTPPPPPEPETTARMRREMDLFFASSAAEDLQDAENSQQHTTGSAPDRAQSAIGPSGAEAGPKIAIRVCMVADADRKAEASEKAIQHYERPRVIHMRLYQPLQVLVDTLADRLEKPAHDLVLVYKGNRIFALSQTPKDLDMFDGAEMEGFEKPVWEKVSRERREERIRLLAGEDAAPRGDSPPPAPIAPLKEPEEGPANIVIKLRGKLGEIRLGIKPDAPVRTILRFYCKKHNLAPEKAEAMYLSIDGERLTCDATVEDLDLDNGDLLDVGGI